AVAAYQVGAESKLLKPAILKVAVKFQSDHKKHAEVLHDTLVKLGGKPVMAKTTAEYGFPTGSLKSQKDVLRFAAGLEKGRISAPSRYSRTATSPRRRAASSATRRFTLRC